MIFTDHPPRQGLYDPWYEHEACGIGFVVDLKGRKSRDTVEKGLQILLNLEHRGACGCESNTGDGAGILVQMPHAFLAEECESLRVRLPGPGQYATGMLFLPTAAEERSSCRQILERIVSEEGQHVLGWRTVPTDNFTLGATARASEPIIRQIFIGRDPAIGDDAAFERKLYVIRKRAEKAIRSSGLRQKSMFYICSLSYKTIVYKGMLMAHQLMPYFPDLSNPRMETALAMVHSRFSTNTFPSWARAHPYRYLCHNGEINTLRGNINWMRARESMFASTLFGDDLPKTLPVIDESGSDSAIFDNVLELLVLAGRSVPHAMMMMIPEPWSKHELMSPEIRDFYEYHSCLMEPWDGPAAMAFTDGVRIGAVLDRNGLRPSRYYVTKDDIVILASEVGVLDIPPEQVFFKGKLQPGRMLLVDTESGRIVDDEDLKLSIATERPYGQWVRKNLVKFSELPGPPHLFLPDHETVRLRQRAFGYTYEDLTMILGPMAQDGTEPIGSMGNDAPLAVLSDRPQLLYNYFKQLFAQVTNPPIDSIREELIMSVETSIGPERNLLEPAPEAARQIELHSPILSNEELEVLRHLDGTDPGGRGFKTVTLPTLYRVEEGKSGLGQAMEELCDAASQAISDGHEFIILSDWGLNRQNAPIPALLAVSGVHHHLIREGTRSRVGLIVESGEPREVHHFALLIGYGASAVNPYLAFETLDDMIRQGLLSSLVHRSAVRNYVKAVSKGILKVMAKMGISTIQSYHGAQVYEAIGLHPDFVEKYFRWTPSRVSGIGLEEVAAEVQLRHRSAFPDRAAGHTTLEEGGNYKWRSDGESHLFNPETIHALQQACRANEYSTFKRYSSLVNDQSRKHCTLRGLFELKLAPSPVPIEEVEPVEAILRRFKSGAMSYGSISQEAHETLAIAMNRIGGKSNTGEGGEDPSRYTPEPNGDSRNSAIKQVASARFGVTSEYLVNARELQIKMAQGAKPGEGGQLPGAKVYPWIAKVRHSTPGVGLISPPPHHDIYSIEDLAELIHDLKNANSQARISVKLVAEVGVGTIAAGVSKAKADVVLISGHDGGTGASPLTGIKHAGIPWEIGLAETQQVLMLNDLRSRITVEVDGQLKTGRDVVIGALLGAEEFGFATAPLVAMGCLMMRACHLNTCPAGIATQDPRLRRRFAGTPEHVVNFMRFIAQEVREWMSLLGFRTMDEMIGHPERLETRKAVDHWKARGLDFSSIFYQPPVSPSVARRCTVAQNHSIEKSLDSTTLFDICQPALESATAVSATLPIRNIHRVVGTAIGSAVTRRYGAQGLPDDTICLHFKGSAGQSLGAFLPRGMTLVLEGDSNDYIGKGLSGGKIVVFPPHGSTFRTEESVIIGNVAFYGATSGEAYISGMAGERFCVRNSGLHAVVEAVGDHGCEYMTGGCVVVLGPTGRNFAAGMSGGIAYILDIRGDFPMRCNADMVGLHALEESSEVSLVYDMIRRHVERTRSRRGSEILERWTELLPRFIKVYPNDYRRVIDAQRELTRSGMSKEAAVMAAFEENAHDLARVGGT
jgi:glutamate synthase domain-containing protein 2/glutamate synthase domain-containing protein 1/glutamate synthase domain-containing protein 3